VIPFPREPLAAAPRPPRPPLPGAFYQALVGLLLFAFAVTILIPVVPLFITDRLGSTEQWIGTATLILAFTAVTSRIPTGTLSDRQGRRRWMLIGALLSLAASLFYLASHSIAVFLLARIGTGAALGVFTTASKALSADLAPPSRRGEALGLNNATFSVAGIFSPLVGEGLKNALGFEAVFALSGALSLLALLVTYTLPADHPDMSESNGARRDAVLALRQRGTWAAILLIVSAGALLTLMFTFYPLLAERSALYDDAPRLLAAVAMGLGLSIWSLIDTVIEPVAGRVSDAIGRQPVALPGLVIAAAGVVLLSRAAGTASAYAAIALMASGWGMMRAIADAIAQDAIPPALRGIGTALLYTSFDLAIGINAQLLGGMIDGADFDAFFTATLALFLGFGALGFALATRLRTYTAPQVAPAPTDPAR